MEWFKDKLRKWLGIDQLEKDNQDLLRKVQSYKESNRHFQNRLDELDQLVKECTSVSADIHYHHKHDSIVFVAGRYRNRDYVKLFNVQHNNMNHMVDILKDMEQTNRRGFYDEPHLNMNIKGWIDR